MGSSSDSHLKYTIGSMIIIDDLHEDLLENRDTDQMLQSIFDRIHAADIKTKNALQIRLGKEGTFIMFVKPGAAGNPYIFRAKRENGEYIFSRCFTASSLEILLYGKTRMKLEEDVRNILENRETYTFAKMPEAERDIFVRFTDKLENSMLENITTQTNVDYER